MNKDQLFFNELKSYIDNNYMTSSERKAMSLSLFKGSYSLEDIDISKITNYIKNLFVDNVDTTGEILFKENSKFWISSFSKMQINDILGKGFTPSSYSSFLEILLDNFEPKNLAFNAPTNDIKLSNVDMLWISENLDFFANEKVSIDALIVDKTSFKKDLLILNKMGSQLPEQALENLKKKKYDNFSNDDMTDFTKEIFVNNKSSREFVVSNFDVKGITFETFEWKPTDLKDFINSISVEEKNLSDFEWEFLKSNKEALNEENIHKLIKNRAYKVFELLPEKLLEYKIDLNKEDLEETFTSKDGEETNNIPDIDNDAKRQYAINYWEEVENHQFAGFVYPLDRFDIDIALELEEKPSNLKEIIENLTGSDIQEIYNRSDADDSKFVDWIKDSDFGISWDILFNNERLLTREIYEIKSLDIDKKFIGILESHLNELITEINNSENYIKKYDEDIISITLGDIRANHNELKISVDDELSEIASYDKEDKYQDLTLEELEEKSKELQREHKEISNKIIGVAGIEPEFKSIVELRSELEGAIVLNNKYKEQINEIIKQGKSVGLKIPPVPKFVNNQAQKIIENMKRQISVFQKEKKRKEAEKQAKAKSNHEKE